MKKEDLLRIRATEIVHMLVNLTEDQNKQNLKPFVVGWEENKKDLQPFVDNVEEILKHPTKNKHLIYLLTNLLISYQI